MLDVACCKVRFQQNRGFLGQYPTRKLRLGPFSSALLSRFTLASRPPTAGMLLPRNCGSPQSTGILCAEFPSFREFSKSTAAAGPTKFPKPTPRPHPPRRPASHPSEEISFPPPFLL